MIISETTLNCCKPNRLISFKNSEPNESSTRKVRYKHYEQMSDDVLSLRSVLKAHKDVQESGKMRLFKAMPAITTGLLGLTIGLTQPGKLAAKAGAGLGFLALTNAICAGSDIIANSIDKQAKNEKETSTAKKVFKTVAAIAGVATVGTLAVIGAKNTKAFKAVGGFLSKEAKQLANEINNTKLAKFFDNTVAPFAQKHAQGVSVLKAIAPLGVLVGSAAAQVGLADDISLDIKEKAVKNFMKGKAIQAEARAHFDSIDAEEV